MKGGNFNLMSTLTSQPILSLPLLPYFRKKGFHISDHAYRRLVNRFELTCSGAYSRAHNAWLYGHPITDYTGILRYYLNGEEITAHRKYARNVIFKVYGDGLFLFIEASCGLCLITVIQIPEVYYHQDPKYAAEVEAVEFQSKGWASRYVQPMSLSSLFGQ